MLLSERIRDILVVVLQVPLVTPRSPGSFLPFPGSFSLSFTIFTGALAGLAKMLFSGADLNTAFENEMCEKGYSAGNPRKPVYYPAPVAAAIRQELTPLFLKLAYKIEKGEITLDRLSTSACSKDPRREAAFKPILNAYESGAYNCDMSSRFYP